MDRVCAKCGDNRLCACYQVVHYPEFTLLSRVHVIKWQIYGFLHCAIVLPKLTQRSPYYTSKLVGKFILQPFCLIGLRYDP
jgi:hypothetical protein